MPRDFWLLAYPLLTFRAHGLTVKLRALLHGPFPAAPYVWIHHWAAPWARAVLGVTLQVPVPIPQPASAAVYHCVIFTPVLSFTQR